MEKESSAENVTMHGIGRITGTKSLAIRAFWALLMFGFSSICLYHLFIIVSKYFSNVSVIKESTLIAPQLQFPAVTICGPGISREKFAKFAEEKNVSITPSTERMKQFGIKKNHHGFDLLDRVIKTKDNLLKVIPDKDEFLLKGLDACSFGINNCNYSVDYQELLLFFRSYCYKFNHDGKFMQNRAGSIYGFSIILFLNTSDVETWSFFENGDAAEVVIQPHTEYPFFDSGTVLVPTGHLSHIQIQQTEIERMGAPYQSNCTNGENRNIIYPGAYTTPSCLESCFAFATAKECNVADFHSNAFLPNGSKAGPMITWEDTECYLKVYDNLVLTNFSSCNCNLPCHERKYHKSVSYSKWPATADLPFYKKVFGDALGLNASAMTDDFVRNNFLKISVFFGDMTYKKLTEERKYALENLVSDIGGQMGIWLGASMFSIIELLCLLVQIFCSFVASKSKKQVGSIENQGHL